MKINRTETPYGWVPWRQDSWELDIKRKNLGFKIESVSSRGADYAEILSVRARVCPTYELKDMRQELPPTAARKPQPALHPRRRQHLRLERYNYQQAVKL